MTHPWKLDLPAGGGALSSEEAPAAVRARLRSLFERSPFGFFLADPSGTLLEANPVFCSLLGRPCDALIGGELAELAGDTEDADDYRRQVEAFLGGEIEALAGEWRMGRQAAHARWLHVTLTPLRGIEGAPFLLFGEARDVSEDRQRREVLRRAARVDPLTGAGNRTAVLQCLRDELSHARRACDGLALIFGDLDNFKLINDSLGHEAGDAILRLVAERLRESLRADDLVGRVGGDEFVVVLRGAARPEDPERVATSLLEVVQRDVRIDGHRVVPGISLGVARAEPGIAPEDLLRRADIAMYRAKARGGGRVVLFDEHMQAESKARFHLEEAIREGLDANEFTTYFQPILSLENQGLFGVEALCRWRRANGDEVPARDFLDVAIESRTIDRLGAVVLEDVIRFVERVDVEGALVTMNLTADEIQAGGTIERIEAAVAAGRLDPLRFGLELTEAATACLSPACRERLLRVIARGVSLFLDDFGTGFSSITTLRDLPVRGIKLAPMFVANLHQDADLRLAEGLASFAERLGIERIAEGVETEVQEEALRRIGWPYVQGYRYGEAKPLVAWLR